MHKCYSRIARIGCHVDVCTHEDRNSNYTLYNAKHPFGILSKVTVSVHLSYSKAPQGGIISTGTPNYYKIEQSLPEMNSNRNCVHGVSMTTNEKASKKYPLESKTKRIQVRDLGATKDFNDVRISEALKYNPGCFLQFYSECDRYHANMRIQGPNRHA